MELSEVGAVVRFGALRSAGTPPTGSSSGTPETWTRFGPLGSPSVPAVAFPMANAAMKATTRAASTAIRCVRLNDNCAA